MTKKFFLISEEVYAGDKPLIESTKDKKGNLYLEGVFAQANIVNRNQHLYPKEVLEKAVDGYRETYMKYNQALGELNHPEHLYVDPKEACVKIESLEWDGDNLIGRAKVLEGTPNGKIVKALIEDGVTLGVSTRGGGSVITASEGHEIINEDFELVAIDVVTNPAAPEAYTRGIYESVAFIKEGDKFVPVRENVNTRSNEDFVRAFLDELRRGL